MSDKRKPIVIDAPHVPPSKAGPRDAESRAVASHPEFQALITEGRRNRAAGKGLTAADVFDEPEAEEEGTEGAAGAGERAVPQRGGAVAGGAAADRGERRA